jgi:hypothetical protein
MRGTIEIFRALPMRLSAISPLLLWVWPFLVVLRGEVTGRGPIYLVVTLSLSE